MLKKTFFLKLKVLVDSSYSFREGNAVASPPPPFLLFPEKDILIYLRRNMVK